MYQQVIVSFACADVSDSKHRGLRMFLLTLMSEYQNSVKKSKPLRGYKKYVE